MNSSLPTRLRLLEAEASDKVSFCCQKCVAVRRTRTLTSRRLSSPLLSPVGGIPWNEGCRQACASTQESSKIGDGHSGHIKSGRFWRCYGAAKEERWPLVLVLINTHKYLICSIKGAVPDWDGSFFYGKRGETGLDKNRSSVQIASCNHYFQKTNQWKLLSLKISRIHSIGSFPYSSCF